MDKPAERADLGVAAFRDGPLAAWITDPSRRIAAWTEEAEAMTGYAAAEAIGLPVHALYTPGDQRKALPELELVSAIGGVRSFRGVRVRRDTTYFAVWSRVLPVRDQGGRPVGFVELVAPDPSRRNGFAALEPQLGLEEVVRTARLELRALHFASSRSGVAPRASVHERIINLVDQLLGALEELQKAGAK